MRLAVGRTGDAFFAVDGICPHAGAVLGDGSVDDGLLLCPVHAYAFDVASGRCDEDPSCSLKSYPVEVRDGVVRVRLGGG